MKAAIATKLAIHHFFAIKKSNFENPIEGYIIIDKNLVSESWKSDNFIQVFLNKPLYSKIIYFKILHNEAHGR